VKTNLEKLRSIQTTKQTRWKLRAELITQNFINNKFSSPFHVLKKLSHFFSSWFLYRKMQCGAVALKSKKTNWRNYVMIIHAQILVTNFNLWINWNLDWLNEYKTIGIWRQASRLWFNLWYSSKWLFRNFAILRFSPLDRASSKCGSNWTTIKKIVERWRKINVSEEV